ncbi:hypothetical protein FHR24_002040 [Wenyingzhuangia heitensis]|uniref:GH16 domain-containing protein n=1 Tax=Wenyingzhuangia heitensis TaxID=1487859 RepID=A0ABX0UEW4_9FLAO|nr:RICIN domain-containing protein [Wenyingzhuangia heitensis]NIJ45572.1 hypothetical protein [Wenyingzhuangia heitensis]
MKKRQFFKRKITLLLILAFVVTQVVNAQNNPTFSSDPKPFGKKWIKVDNLTDEFNDNSLDSNKWTKSTWNYDIPVEMTADNANSGEWDGYLWIRATLDQGAERWFRSARIMSKEKISYPMYTESRIRSSNISAYTTYWLNNGDINNRDEIDIIENNAAPTCGCDPDFPWRMNSQYFQADENKTPQTVRKHGNFDNRNLSSNNPLKGTKWNEEFHVFGAYWSDSKNVQFYLDGEPAGSIYVGDHLDGNSYEREFTRDLNIIWDLWTTDADWIGGLANQNDLTNNNINTMYVDWVRTWKLESKEFFIKNKETGKKIRTNGATDFTNIEQVPYSWSGAPTKWKMVDAGNNYFYLVNTDNGKYFRPKSDNTSITSDADGTPMIQVPDSYTGDFTKFKKVSTSATGNYFYLENKATGMYFRPENDNDYSKLQQRPNTYGGNWTQWQFIDVNTGTLVTQTPSEEIQTITANNFKTEENTSFNISPNPVTKGNELTVYLGTNSGNTKLAIYNVYGNLVKHIETNTTTTTINTSQLKGVYILKVETETQTYNQKFIVK